MLNKEQKREIRSSIFRHLDGLAVIPSAYVLQDAGVLNHFALNEQSSLRDLSGEFKANKGYLNVALRVLASQGWLEQRISSDGSDVHFTLTPKGVVARTLLPHWKAAYSFLQFTGQFHPRKFEKEPFNAWKKLVKQFENGLDFPEAQNELEEEVQAQMLAHVEGLLAAPSIVLLGMGGMFHKYFMDASFRPDEYHSDPESFSLLLDFFAARGWMSKNGDTYTITDEGLFLFKRASAYGVTVSYLPTFRRVKELVFGDPKALRNVADGDTEIHVDRAMNVWGSGGAHSTYFKRIDEIVIELFNRPIEDQPKGILDMGCGNGAFLIHLFDVIEQRTERGKMLDEHPLFLVGADFNKAALKVTRANLIAADIWAKVVWGDIGKPKQLADDLKSNYNIDLGELLNVRTFLDHNRVWKAPANVDSGRKSESTGAYVHRGEWLNNARVEESLKEHFEAWKPFVAKFGLILIELHTVDPAITSANVGNTPATAYDATHGYSDQYILEADVFLNVAEEAGLKADPRVAARFPDKEYCTVTINRFVGA